MGKRIYTKTGDSGSTTLVGRKIVLKNSPWIESYGTIDELNAFIGLTMAEIELRPHCDAIDEEIKDLLQQIQNRLFDLGGLLATLTDEWEHFWPGQSEKIATATSELENRIDQFENELEPIRQFILPSGNRLISLLHVCRTICRRAERCIAALVLEYAEYSCLIPYVNRLSDFFFILARFYHKKDNINVNTYKSIK